MKGLITNTGLLSAEDRALGLTLCSEYTAWHEATLRINNSRNGAVTPGQQRELEAFEARFGELRALINHIELQGLKDFRTRHPNFKIVLPEDIRQVFGVDSIGEIAPVPDGLLSILESQCDLYPNKKVHQTHFLYYLPTHLGGTPFNLLLLHLKGSEAFQVRDDATKLFLQSQAEIWWPNQPFAIESPSSGAWLLLPKEPLSGTLGLTYDNQQPIVDRYTNYETAKAIELVTGLILTDLVHKTRYYRNSYGFCVDTTIKYIGKSIEAGLRVGSGGFDSFGLNVRRRDAAHRPGSTGRAGRRKLSNQI